MQYFNPRPRKEGDFLQRLQIGRMKYFNPRPRKEGDIITYILARNDDISIHALAKRATTCERYAFQKLTISIHALAKRATFFKLILVRTVTYFNPRPRKEGDTTSSAVSALAVNFNPRPRKEGDQSYYKHPQNGYISIHALAKRATDDSIVDRTCPIISIHALAKRATANLYNDYLYFEAKYHISDIFPL